MNKAIDVNKSRASTVGVIGLSIMAISLIAVGIISLHAAIVYLPDVSKFSEDANQGFVMGVSYLISAICFTVALPLLVILGVQIGHLIKDLQAQKVL